MGKRMSMRKRPGAEESSQSGLDSSGVEVTLVPKSPAVLPGKGHMGNVGEDGQVTHNE